MKVRQQKKRLSTRLKKPAYYQLLPGAVLPTGPNKWDELAKQFRADGPRRAFYL